MPATSTSVETKTNLSQRIALLFVVGVGVVVVASVLFAAVYTWTRPKTAVESTATTTGQVQGDYTFQTTGE